jgi:hypothetical protein
MPGSQPDLLAGLHAGVALTPFGAVIPAAH